MVTPQIYNIYVGPFNATTIALLDYLAANIASGTPNWYTIVERYYGRGTGVRYNSPGPPVFKGHWLYESKTSSLAVSDDYFQSLILPDIIANNLKGCSSCIYMVMFHGAYTLAGWNDPNYPGAFCGYHTLYDYGNFTAKVSIIGDPSTTLPSKYDGCIGFENSVNGDLAADSIANVWAHLLAGLITDSDGKTWYSDSDGSEIADKCNFYFGTDSNFNYKFGTKRYAIQWLWLPSKGCVPDKPPQRPNDEVPTPSPIPVPTAGPNLPGELTFHSPGGTFADAQGSPISLYHIYLGEISSNTISLINYFGTNIASTDWYKILTTYYDYWNVIGQVYFNSAAKFVEDITLAPTAKQLQLTRADIENYLAPLYNAFTATNLDVYVITFRGDFNVSINGKLWLKDWCSYHGSFLILPANYVFKYALVGDPSTAPGGAGQACIPFTGGVSPNGNVGADSVAVGYAQQLAQTLTDSQHYTWYSDVDGSEVSSACLGSFGNYDTAQGNSNLKVGSKEFLVQEIWQRGVGCTLEFVP